MVKQDAEIDEEEEKQYLFSVPPDGQSAVCKLDDVEACTLYDSQGSMVFLKRSSCWKDLKINEKKTNLLSKPIESLIDEVRENRIRVNDFVITMKIRKS